ASALKLTSLGSQIAGLTKNENRAYARAAMAALASISPQDAEKQLREITGESNPLDLRLSAVAELAKVSPTDAAKIAVSLLNKLDDPASAQDVFRSFMTSPRRVTALAE